MRLVFRRMEIHNFLSYEDEVFEFDKHRGMNLVCGKNLDLKDAKNGCGKSVLFVSLVYGLFGTMPYRLKNENIPNRYVKDKNTLVTVWFDSGKRKYKVASGMRGRASFCELYELSKSGDEENITKSTIAETRSFMEREILHCDLDLFMRTVVLNSDPNYNFYNLKHAGKKEFIDKLFDISVFGDIYETMHRDTLRMEKDIVAHQNQLIVLNKSAEDYEKKKGEYEANREAEIARLEKEIKTEEEKLSKKKATAAKKNTEFVAKCEKGIAKIEAIVSGIDSKLHKASVDDRGIRSDIGRCKSSIAERKKYIDRFAEIKSKLCKDCKPVFSKYYKLDDMEKDIEKNTAKIAELEQKIAEIAESTKELNASRRDYLQKQERLSNELSKQNSVYEKAQNELRQLEIQLGSKKSRVASLGTAVNPYENLIQENAKRIADETAALDEIVGRYKYVKFAEGIVNQDNLKKFIIKDLVGLLNGKIKHYLHRLGANYDIVFDDEMNYDFITHNKAKAEFHNFSSGEQARISISTCFAFRDFLSTRSNLSSNILVIDEFIDGNVDSLAIDNVLDILKEFAEVNKQNIYVISHRKEIDNSVFDNIIQVEKKDNISQIKYL